jgi:hypothetical protein
LDENREFSGGIETYISKIRRKEIMRRNNKFGRRTYPKRTDENILYCGFYNFYLLNPFYRIKKKM